MNKRAASSPAHAAARERNAATYSKGTERMDATTESQPKYGRPCDMLGLMRIDTQPGDKVAFVHPHNGQYHDIGMAMDVLEVGGVYTVDEIQVHQSSTSITLREFPAGEVNGVRIGPRRFNSVQFTNVPA